MVTKEEAGRPRAGFLDVCRGVAIVGVMAVHTSQNFKTGQPLVDGVLFTGQFGVQLFFAVSAFTMCLTLEQRLSRDRRPFLAFLIRRSCRLAVPMWVAIALYLGFAAAGNTHFASTSSDPWIVAATALLINGVWPAAFGAVVPGGGSIATEALFYLVFPALFALRHRVSALAIACIAIVLFDHGLYRPVVRALFVAIDGTAVASPQRVQEIKQFFHYGLVNQLPVFLLGMLVFTLTQNRRWLSRRETAWWAVAIAMFCWGSTYLALVACAAAVVMVLLWRFRSGGAVLEWLGQRSYSLYLFHFAVLNAVIVLMPRWPSQLLTLVVALLAVVLLSSAVAFVTRPLLEDRGTALGRRLVAALHF